MAQLAEEILAALDTEQRAVATAVRGPVCVIAGAGTGKTRAITHRLAYAVDIGVVDPQRILALTFTARAAGEMRTRLRALGVPNVAARTFHAAALKQLMYFWPHVLGGRFPSLLTTKTGFLGEAINRANVSATKSNSVLRDVAGEIEWAKVIGLAPDEYIKAVDDYARPIRVSNNKVDATQIAKVYEAYESLKKQERAIDFEDVLLLTVGMLEEERDVRDRVRDQYRYFTVDEYQDVSPLQQRLLDLWLGKRDDICVVGDPAQTIYSFAGATPAFLLNFTNKYPGAEVIRLTSGYRSTPEIINTANTILRSASLGHELDAINEHGEKPEAQGFKTEKEEIDALVNLIQKDLTNGIHGYEIAILARTNSQLESFEAALNAAGIENQIRNAERFFNRTEVREILKAIRSASVLSEGDWLADLRDAMKPFGESEYVRAFLQLARELETEGLTSLRGFLRELEDRAEQNNPPTLPGVALATLHAAKGLEWKKVYLAGVSADILPWGSQPAEEERRLFYVGVTRAQQSLVISYYGVPSPFLAEAGL
ncbi:MAG TPA: ATP-dependent helicase [Candidatus Nanopelagicaceae bacterium]|nr:ATP-dependent helicase [Candidatus Nanopelagicaceae bacterium]